MSLITYIFLFSGALIGGITVLFVKLNNKTLKLFLSFSGAYLFSICVLHLIPEIYTQTNNTVGIYILLGFFLQIFLEFFSEGIEHGHVHIHKHEHNKFPFAVMLSLSVHSFLEGMPLTQNLINNPEIYHTLLVGIILHNIPVSIALMSMLIGSNVSKRSSIIGLVAFALMAPLGAITNQFISSGIDTTTYMNNIMGVVIGIFLHISTTILFESSENHRFNLLKFLIILMGASLALIHF